MQLVGSETNMRTVSDKDDGKKKLKSRVVLPGHQMSEGYWPFLLISNPPRITAEMHNSKK